ncbi:MAG: GMC family oxidoreductase [Deltaproteobacteria bacterium]
MAQKKKKYDCVVIGSGPGGAPFAWRLASRGMDVLLLEAGGRFDPYRDYPLSQNDWELKTFPHSSSIRQVYGEAQPLDDKFEHLKSWNKASGKFNNQKTRKYAAYQHVSGLGGATLHFQGEAHRLSQSAFRMKSLFGVAEDWPIGYGDLEPYYTEVEKILGVAGPEGALPNRPRAAPYPLPAHKLSYASQVIQRGCKKLGLSLTPNTVAILSAPYRGTPPCNYCNGCTWGCPRKDKGSVDVTFIPLLEKTGKCEILTGAFARRIEVEKKPTGQKARGVYYFDKSGKESFAEADFIAVACGAIETPRLLLNSGIKGEGAVGRNFMETVFYQAVAFHPERVDSYRGIPIDSVVWKWNEPKDKKSGLKGGLRLFPTVGSATGPLNYALRYSKGWGDEFVADINKWFGHAVAIGGIAEFLPNKDTFVTVSDKEKDEFGAPLAKIQSFNAESEIKLLDFMAKTSKEILKASGAGEIVEEFSTYDFFAPTHVFGTCRMGKDPAKSVVGQDLRSHEIANLFVTDASVFPSSGGGDAPSLTIEALSLRAADLLVKNLKKG